MDLPKLNELATEATGDALSKHEKRELEKKQKDEEKLKKQQEAEKKKKIKSYINYAIIGLIVIALLYLVYSAFSGPKKLPYARGNPDVHWHAAVELQVCGQIRDDLNTLGVRQHEGSPTLHTHGDGVMHIEAPVVWDKKDISLGKFFDNVNLKFSETQLLDKKNGDLCNGKLGKVKLFVNSKENNAFRDYSPVDGDKIKIIFE